MVARLVALVLLLAPSAHAFEVCDAAKDPSAFDPNDRWALIAEQGHDGWIFAQGELLTPASLGASVSTMARFTAALRAAGTLPVLVAIPNRLTLAEDKLDRAKKEFASYKPGGMSARYKEHIQALTKAGWEAPNLVELGVSSGLGADFFNHMDHHWSTQGARVTADAVAALIKASPLSAGIPAKPFKLLTTEVINPGSYRWVVLDRCGVNIPAELSKSYKAESEDAVSADSLLGDEAPAEIVLLGTSQSRRQDFDAKANRQYFEDSFSALLRSALQMDVENLAAAGGGTYTSIDGWLTSRGFQKKKPKVVIWEMNDSEGFEHEHFLRGLVPAVHGRCSKSDAIAQGSGMVADGIRLEVPANLEVSGVDYYLALKFTDAALVDFTTTFHHGKSKDTVSMHRSPLLPNSKLFFTELAARMTGALTAVSVAAPSTGSGKWEARICKAN